MIFRQIEEVKSGRKTQTRRCWKVGESCLIGDDGRITAVVRNGRIKYHVGQSYPIIPKMFLPSVGRHTIERIRIQLLHDISESDAWAEGVENVAAYAALWSEINRKRGTRWDDNPPVWVYDIAYLNESPVS